MNTEVFLSNRQILFGSSRTKRFTLNRVLTIGLLLCIGLFAPPCAGGNPVADSLSPNHRMGVFDAVWKTINEEYYDAKFNGVNWAAAHDRYRPNVVAAKTDQEFYAVISQMLMELQDLHTSFVPPDGQPRSSGVSVAEVEHQIAIVDVEADSDAARAGVKPGMIVRTFDGKPIEARLDEVRARLGSWANQQAYHFIVSRLLVGGPANTTFKLSLERADGTHFEVDLTRRVVANAEPKVTSRRLQSGIAYIKISGALRSPVADQFLNELKSLKDSPGLIIDLRGISGGDILGVGLKIVDQFFTTKVPFGKFTTRSGETAPHRSLSAAGSNQAYTAPVVILVDEKTRSAGEVFAGGFQDNGRAKIVGVPSCGCVLDIESKKVKGGGVLQYSHFGFMSSKGRKLEGNGVVPNTIVPLTIASLRQGRDIILEEAEHLLTSK